MKISRRGFIQTSAAVAGVAALSDYTFGGPATTAVKKALGSEAPTKSEEKWVPTTCWVGKQDCGMLTRVVDGRVVKLEGHPDHPRNRGKLCPKGISQLMLLYDPYRVKAPLKRTNEKGVHGEWTQISWDEALTEVASKIKEAVAKDPKLFVWQKGRSKAKDFYDDAFVKSTGAGVKLHHGAYCSDAAYRGFEYTLGMHGGVHPDFKHCNYLINWGWNITGGGGNKFCWLTWNQQFVEARERGMKVVTVDPFLRQAAHHTDEWLPIKPGTDLAFFLALANVIIAGGLIDEAYLRNHTNAPFLVKDNSFVRIGGKEQVWDLNTNSPKPHDAGGVNPALEGSYVVEGSTVKTAYQLFKEHVSDMTPEKAAGITGLSARQIRKVAEELVENAMIGSTVMLDGVQVPYRPVGLMGYHVAQQELGFQAVRAAAMVFMLLGAIESVGGIRVDFARKVDKRWPTIDSVTIKDPPYNLYLKDSKFYPINSNNSSIVAQAMLNPKKYGLDVVPEVLFIHMANPLASFPGNDLIAEAYKKFKFIVVMDPWLSETADYFADIVLPAATMEKYEGPMNATDQYEDAYALRIPPISPLYDTKGDIEIYMDLCEKIGVLFGEGGYLDIVNKEIKLSGEYKLDLNTKPKTREIYDRWAKNQGVEGITYFEKKGVLLKGKISADKLYAPAWSPPYGGIKHRFFGESLARYQREMKEKGADEVYYRDYTAFPTWRTPTFHQSPPDYDLHLISFKHIEYKQSRSTWNPLLLEVEPRQRLYMNAQTAADKGLAHGDSVWVESQNAITGETKRVKTTVFTTELIRPDTVAMAHHFGMWAHPLIKDAGPSPNSLFFTGEGYVTNTADQTFHVNVKVWKEV